MEKIDKLNKALETSKGTDRVDTLNDLAFAYYYSDPEKTEEFANDALILAKKMHSQKRIARSYNIIGISFHRRSNYYTAMKYYKKALTIFKKIGDDPNSASTKHNIGCSHEKLGNHSLALKYYYKSLTIWEKEKSKKRTSACYNNIGIIYEKQKNYDLALEYHIKSLTIKNELNDKYGASVSHLNIGVIHYYLQEYELGLKSILKSIEIKTEIGDTIGLAHSYVNLGSIYDLQKKNDLSMKYLKKALTIFEKTSNKYDIATTCESIGITYSTLKNYDNALKFLDRGLELAKEIESKSLQASLSEDLYKLFATQKKYKKALEYFQIYNAYTQDFYTEEKTKQISEMQAKYESKAKEKETEIFKLKNIKLAKANKRLEKEIQEHQKTNIELQKSEEKFRFLSENTKDIICLHKFDSTFEYISPSCKINLGYDPEELIGTSPLKLVYPEDLSHFIEQYKKNAKAGKQQNSSFTYRIRKKSGEYTWFESLNQIIRDKDGDIISSVSSSRDVNERKKAEVEILENKEHLKILNSILRHDVINDLAVIKSGIKILAKHNDPTIHNEISLRIAKAIDTIDRQRRQESYLDKHLDLKKYHLENVLKKTVKNYQKITINITGSASVYADEKIYSVFDNLISNSVNHGKASNIEIFLSKDKDNHYIEFRDNGIGIPNKEKTSIFNKGYSFGKTGNTGMGLYIVEQTIEGYGGSILIKDNQPQGAIFLIKLKGTL